MGFCFECVCVTGEKKYQSINYFEKTKLYLNQLHCFCPPRRKS